MTEPQSRSDSRRRRVYTVYGINLVSDFPFVSRLIPSAGIPDLSFSAVHASPLPVGWDRAKPLYTSPLRRPDGESITYLYRFGAMDVLRFTGIADFYVGRHAIRSHLLDRAYDFLVEIRLLGQVLSYWLERQGIPALHASAVVVEGRAVAFLSSRRGGKSTLAASFLQAGHPLLADDILPVEDREGSPVVRPGYPQMRLWPEAASYFLGASEDFPRVHPAYSKRRVPVGGDGFGSFCNASKELACLYLPEQFQPPSQCNDVEITAVSPRDAVIELVRHSFSAEIVEAARLQPQRLRFFSQMAQKVPVRRIAYPRGLQHLLETREAILDDIKGLV